MSMTPIAGEEQATNQTLQDALGAYLESGGTDEEARARVEALPGGAAAIARALAIKVALAPYAGDGRTVERYLAWKQEEIQAEAERDRRRDAFHAATTSQNEPSAAGE
jgi:hypothetical protein